MVTMMMLMLMTYLSGVGDGRGCMLVGRWGRGSTIVLGVGEVKRLVLVCV